MLKQNYPVGSVGWFHEQLERGENEIFSQAIDMGPSLATELLSRNTGNRNLKNDKLLAMVKDIKSGAWQNNGETIIISSDGHLNDGQHRCEAVIRAKESIPVLLVFGVSRESRLTVDQGAARSAGDILRLNGVANSAALAAAVRLALSFNETKGTSLSEANRCTTAMVTKFIEENPDIITDNTWAANKRVNFITPSYVAFCRWVFRHIHEADAVRYIEAVIDGDGVRRGEPAWAVRNRFMGGRLTRNEAIEVMFRGFLAFRERRQLSRAMATGQLPKLV